MNLSWMAWTLPTALFFCAIASILIGMAVWHRLRPSPAPRPGLIGIATQRGDRLFLSLLGAAFIHLGWIGMVSAPLWGATMVSLAFALLVFRFV